MSEGELKQYRGGLIPGPSRRTTDPFLQAQGALTYSGRQEHKLLPVRSKHLPTVMSGEPQPLCPGVKPIKMSHLELLSESPFRLKR